MTAASALAMRLGAATSGNAVAAFHRKKHAVFQRMHADQMAYRELMK